MEATPPVEEFHEYARREERENSRLRDIRDLDQLEPIHRELLRAEDASALRAVLSRHAANR